MSLFGLFVRVRHAGRCGAAALVAAPQQHSKYAFPVCLRSHCDWRSATNDIEKLLKNIMLEYKTANAESIS